MGVLVMSDNWSLNSTNFADLDWRTIQGQPGLGFHRFMAYVAITLHPRSSGEEVSVMNIHGELSVSGHGGPEHFLAYLRRQDIATPLTTYPHIQKRPLTLEVELDGGRMEALERIRLGGDLSFRMNLSGVACGREGGPQPVQATLHYRANQSTWMETLAQMGYRRTMLMEVSVLSDAASPQWPEAAKHLQAAQTHMLRGHFRDAVGACRDVMEALSAALNDEGGQVPEAIKSWFEGTRSMGKEERLRIVRRAFKLMTHPARHADEVSTSIEWGPEDAKAALIITAALVNLAGEKR